MLVVGRCCWSMPSGHVPGTRDSVACKPSAGTGSHRIPCSSLLALVLILSWIGILCSNTEDPAAAGSACGVSELCTGCSTHLPWGMRLLAVRQQGLGSLQRAGLVQTP